MKQPNSRSTVAKSRLAAIAERRRVEKTLRTVRRELRRFGRHHKR